jgi:hypothetical protein
VVDDEFSSVDIDGIPSQAKHLAFARCATWLPSSSAAAPAR